MKTKDTTIRIRFSDFDGEDLIDIYDLIVKIDDDYNSADEVESAVIGGMKPDEYYIFTKDPITDRYSVSLKN